MLKNNIPRRFQQGFPPWIALSALLLICLFVCPPPLSAQQLPLFTQYREYYGYINPASLTTDFLASNRYAFNAFGVSHRRQWVGSGFAAVTTSTARGEFFFENNGGPSFLTGGYFMSDKAGSTSFTGLYGRAALFLGDPLSNFFGLGFNVGAVQYTINTEKSNPRVNDPNDPYIGHLPFKIIPDIGVGIFGVMELNRDINLFGGVSMPQLFGFSLNPARSQDQDIDYVRLMHLYNYFGVYINTSYGHSDYSFLEISTWGKYVPGLPYHADFNLRYQITTPLWIGAGLSTAGTVHLETGFNIGMPERDGYMKLGFGYDAPFNQKIGNTYLNNTFEVNLSFIFEKS